MHTLTTYASPTPTRTLGAITADHPHRPILADNFKTKACQHYEATGSCPFQARCMFAHGGADVRTREMNLADSLFTEGHIKAFVASQAVFTAAAGYTTEETTTIAQFKTKACHTFQATGSCPYGHRCMFAHGKDDLRTRELNAADGLTTDQAIRDFQQDMAATARDAQRRKVRNQKKRVKGKAAKAARRQEALKATIELVASAEWPSDGGSDDSVAGDFSRVYKLPPPRIVSASSIASLTDCVSVSTPTRVDVAVVEVPKRYRHDPYKPCEGAAPCAAIRQPAGVMGLAHTAPIVAPLPPANGTPRARRMTVSAAFFPLACALQQLRRGRRRGVEPADGLPVNAAELLKTGLHEVLLP